MSADKTEQPTPKRKRDARKKGQVAKSQDVIASVVTIGCFVSISSVFAPGVTQLEELITLPTHFYTAPFPTAMNNVMLACLKVIAELSLPVCFVAMFMGIAGNIMQVGFLLSGEPIKPELKKLNPLEGVKKIVSMKNLFELGKSTIKVLLIGAVVWSVIAGSLNGFLRLPWGGAIGYLDALGPTLAYLTNSIAGAYVAIAAADFFFQRFQHNKQLRMSKDEVKREYKESEGDPMIKSKRRQLHQEMIASDTTARTRNATVVVTNPTHIAIAIYYKEEEEQMPKILAKGVDEIAHRMIRVAREEGIPVMQHIPLARALYEQVDVDRFVPADLIEPMAEVLRWVRDLHGGAQN